MIRPGICCIVLGLEDRDPPMKFQTMTFSQFSKMERDQALTILGSRILNNINVTFEAIKFCYENNYCYRLSSDLFPLLTYDKAGIKLEGLPCYDPICQSLNAIRTYLSDHNVRISTHPDQFNVLASENQDAVQKTIRELNFQSWFMDQIGCSADYNSPINLHINNNKGNPSEIVGRLSANIKLLDFNCRSRLVFENDDKVACWSVKKLMVYLHSEIGCPITFDYLHHKCHPDGLAEEEALRLCYDSWGSYRPLFHYSESRDEKNIRAHADNPTQRPKTYDLDFDLDFEFKMKDKAVAIYESLENSLETVL